MSLICVEENITCSSRPIAYRPIAYRPIAYRPIAYRPIILYAYCWMIDVQLTPHPAGK